MRKGKKKKKGKTKRRYRLRRQKKYTRVKRINKTRRQRGGEWKKTGMDGNEFIIDGLKQHLIDYGVEEEKIEYWGTKRTKSLNNLLTEIINKDTILEYIDNMITRSISVLHVSVYNGENKEYSLYEIGHINQEGEYSPRNTEGIREKFNPNAERPIDALKRGISEELGNKYSEKYRFMKGVPLYDIESPIIDFKDSHSYPGLLATYKTYRDEIFIPELSIDFPPSPGAVFKTEETYSNDEFKRFILWQWRKN